MKGLYKNDNGQLRVAANAIYFPDGTKVEVQKHIKKKEGTEVKDGWLVFHSREAALKHFNIDEKEIL